MIYKQFGKVLENSVIAFVTIFNILILNFIIENNSAYGKEMKKQLTSTHTVQVSNFTFVLF